MAIFKVVLEFIYDSEESTEDFYGEITHKFVTTAEKAIDTAMDEVSNNDAHEFSYSVYDEEGEFLRSN